MSGKTLTVESAILPHIEYQNKETEIEKIMPAVWLKIIVIIAQTSVPFIFGIYMF